MQRNPTRYLVVGDRGYHEFAEPLADLARRGCVVSAAQPLEAAAAWPYAASPDWIILAQSHRRRISDADLARLRRRFPASRCALLCGSWCEGETRSGRPAIDAARLHWSCFIPQFRCLEQAMLEDPRRSPAEWTAWEVMASERQPREAAADHGVAAIRTDDLESFEALADLCELCGLPATWWRGEPLFHRRLRAILWNSPFGRDDVPRIRAAGRQHPDAALIWITGFPRGPQAKAAREAGISLLPKPLQAADLAAAIHRGATTAAAGRQAA